VTDSPVVSIGRLRWLCRRGMLELDSWLTLFLETRHADLSPAMQDAFTHLLDQDDMALFDWLTGEREPPADLRVVVDAIKTTRYQRS
jgi:antitoxin CptB